MMRSGGSLSSDMPLALTRGIDGKKIKIYLTIRAKKS